MALPCYAFDIETGPLPMEQLAPMLKPFDPSEVKVGNLKDQAKIDEKIEKARSVHEQEQISKAALDPATGRVLAIGWLHIRTGYTTIETDERGEAHAIREFWHHWIAEPKAWFGHNVEEFDMRFLINRSRVLGVTVPASAMPRNYRYYTNEYVHDTMVAWCFGKMQNRISLDRLSRVFGLQGKNGSGADFHLLYQLDRKAALDYLKNDLLLTAEVAKRMQMTW